MSGGSEGGGGGEGVRREEGLKRLAYIGVRVVSELSRRSGPRGFCLRCGSRSSGVDLFSPLNPVSRICCGVSGRQLW